MVDIVPKSAYVYRFVGCHPDRSLSFPTGTVSPVEGLAVSTAVTSPPASARCIFQSSSTPPARPRIPKKRIDFGDVLICSVRSAMTRRTRAVTFTSSSCSLVPSAMTPGSSGTSASHRPSLSLSKTMLKGSSSGGWGTVARGPPAALWRISIVAAIICRSEPGVNLNFYCGDNGTASAAGNYLCSKSTGAVTSCTLKYLASAGYFRATASYIA